MKRFDCIVVGGGMVGATSALSLANLGLTIALIEKFPVNAMDEKQPFDLRVSAISLGSQYLLEQVDAWSSLASDRMCPYKRLGVWENEPSYTEFSSEEIEQPYLGHIVENRAIQLALWEQMKKHSRIAIFEGNSLTALNQNASEVIATVGKEQISAKFLMGADGANSQVRQLAGIGITGWDYQQSAILINVETAFSQQDITWQQFQLDGPVAFLPMPGNNASLVWYDTRDSIVRLSKLTNEQLEKEIIKKFPQKLGKFSVKDKGAFPLTRRHANHYYSGRIALLGDAAHTISPMAGQGVNLGFKDVKALKTAFAKAIGEGQNWHDVSVLKAYEKSRRPDNLLMMTSMDILYKTFGHPAKSVSLVRNTALKLVNRAGPIKREALKYACGL